LWLFTELEKKRANAAIGGHVLRRCRTRRIEGRPIHLLIMDSKTGQAEDVTREIADRNDLSCERLAVDGKSGFRFWRIE
jgi:hypothetical protein